MKTLKELPRSKRPGRQPNLDYGELFAHEDVVMLIRGEDFNCTLKTQRHNLYRHSKIHGVKLETVTVPAEDNDGKEAIAFKVIGRNSKKKAKK